jgi:hypothetical protein
VPFLCLAAQWKIQLIISFLEPQNLKSFLFITMYEAPSFQDVQSHFVKFESILETCFTKSSLKKLSKNLHFLKKKLGILQPICKKKERIKGKSPEVPFHGITLPYSCFEVI